MTSYISHFLEWFKLCMLVLWWSGRKGKTFASDLYKNILVYSSDNAQNSNPNVYRPLSHDFIRLLVLYSGKPNEPLRGYLITNRFDNKSSRQRYEALSYVWGDSARRRSMILNNEHFALNENLYAALQHLRSETSNRTLWIDAICINQANDSERNRQVSLMADIYTCASHVVNWLGPSTPNTALGLEILTFLFGDKDITSSPPWQKYKPSLLRAGLQDILQRDYFSRIWVVQENALASKITLQIGSATLTWHSGASTHRAICRLKFAVISPSWETAKLQDIDIRPLLEILEQSMMVTRRKMGKSCREVTVLDQAFDMRYRRATDRRDMLFALRSMVPEDVRRGMAVDYGKGVEELYGEFFREVERAYKGEMEFVRVSEEERMNREGLERKREENRTMGGW